MKQSFILKNSWIGIFDRLSEKQAGMLIKMLFEYNVNGGVIAGMNDEVVNAYFNMMILDCDEFKERYDRRCKTSRENGKLGGAKVGNQNAKKQPKTTKKQPKQPKQPYNENDNENENENENDLKEEKLKKENENSFEEIWEMYGKKGNKKTSERKWENLKNNCREAALNHIPKYVQATPDIQFRKNFETYLNQECWNDEIIIKQQQQQTRQTEKIEILT